MNFDLKIAFKAATMPALALIAMTIIMYVLAAFGLRINGLIPIPIYFAILGYAGYNSVKAFKLDLLNGATTGAIASLLSMIVTIITGFQSILGYFILLSVSNESLIIIFAILIFLLLLSLVIGFIFGIIGAYIAKKK